MPDIRNSFGCFIVLLLTATDRGFPGLGRVRAETLIGCLFSPSVCAPGKEWCYDDMAFGRCLAVDEAVSPEDLRQYNLEPDHLASLESEMERLYALGYRWDQLYTQCVLQALLRQIASGASPPYDHGGCDEAFPEDVKSLSFMDSIGTEEGSDDDVTAGDNSLDVALSLPDPSSFVFTEGTSSPGAKTAKIPDDDDDDSSQISGTSGRRNRLKLLSNILDDPRHLASVRFTPSALNPHTKFADEVYLPHNLGALERAGNGRGAAMAGVMKPSQLEEMSKIASVVLGPADGRQAPRKDGLPMNLLRQELLNEARGGSRDDAGGDVSTVEDLLRFAAGVGSAIGPDYRVVDVDPAATSADSSNNVDNNEPAAPTLVDVDEAFLRDILTSAGDVRTGSNRIEKRVFGIERNVAEKKEKKKKKGAGKKNKKGKGRQKQTAAGTGTQEADEGIKIRESNLKDYDILGGISESMENDMNYFDSVSGDGGDMTRDRKDDSEHNKRNFNNFYRDVLMSRNGEEIVVDPHGAIDLAALWQPRRLQEDDSSSDDDDLVLEGPGGLGYDQDLIGEGSSASGGVFEPMYSDARYATGSRRDDFLLPDGGVLDLSLAGKDLISPLEEEGDFEMALMPNSVEDGPYQRLERMDVKKPGPEFDPRIPPEPPKHHHQQQSAVAMPPSVEDDDPNNSLPLLVQDGQVLLGEDNAAHEHETLEQQEHLNKGLLKGQGQGISADKGEKQHDEHKIRPKSAQTKDKYFRKDYAYLQITKSFANKKEGKKVVASLERLLGLEPGTFTDVRVDGNQVMFKVNPNPQRLNVTDVINGAEQYKEAIKNDVDAEIESGGIGDEIKIAWKDYRATRQEKILLVSLSAVAAVAALMAAGLMVYLVKRYYKRGNKLYNLTKAADTEASKDYQDLCRARMATKAQEKPEPLHKIITGSVKEDQSQPAGVTGSPHSSRSSTSSWSEEPVASNMDISTGHMVLSYMEDHLKNKDKLEQEWLALCAYEADPCSANIANKSENLKKNRDRTTVPYDHARVVLNDLSNISGSDYINASTITDHDPRNPAYIACQGPMAGTAADFWQMVWEQGSVVIVMLTKLAENGTAMCHRYWPEEGSEVYHIYEVHLVSEHIWCEDYLVRSFYLKNLKTGETRTVTQFHFLSWPVDGVPNSTRALLEFRRKVNKSYRGRSCPIIVHCNDGSGRTGTYILIDMVLNRMAKGAKEIDIAATLEHIRDQRPGTVKTRVQFEFVLMAVAEEVHAILKAMPQ